MPANNPQVGEIYHMMGDTSTQWAYVYSTKGPYVTLRGIHSTNAELRMRRNRLRGMVAGEVRGSNGLMMNDGNILGLAGRQRAEGVLFLEGTDDE